MLFNPANLAYWIFLATGVLLFLLVIVSGGGDDDLDVDADVDVDAGVSADSELLEFDTDTDVDADADSDFSPLQILGWLGIGKAPLILLLAIDFSAWGVTGWMLNVGIGNITGSIPAGFFGLGGAVLISSLCFSLFLGSLIARPLGKIFASFGEDVSSDRLIGCVGTVTSKQVPYLVEGKIGQADVLDPARNLVTISITLPQWATVIPHRGQQVLIIDRQKHSYLAIAKESSDEDRWLENSSQIRDSR